MKRRRSIPALEAIDATAVALALVIADKRAKRRPDKSLKYLLTGVRIAKSRKG